MKAAEERNIMLNSCRCLKVIRCASAYEAIQGLHLCQRTYSFIFNLIRFLNLLLQ